LTFGEALDSVPLLERYGSGEGCAGSFSVGVRGGTDDMGRHQPRWPGPGAWVHTPADRRASC